jgi:H/ACA ribonucleoprotein complex subunit 2
MMAKDKTEKIKKEKKEKRSETEGVKKSKKDKKSKLNGDNVAAALEEKLTHSEASVVGTKAIEVKESNGELAVKPVGALVPFANPLADDKIAKKVLKSVKKGMAPFCYSDKQECLEMCADLFCV